MREKVPYGHGELEFTVPPWSDLDTVESRDRPPIGDVAAAARASLAAPLGCPPLRELARAAVSSAGERGARAIIAVTDLTRACPDGELVPPLLDELNAGGIPDERISIIVAVGLHRATTDEEKRTKLGGLVDRVRVFDSDGRDPGRWAALGDVPPYGVPGFVQRAIIDADLVIATGIVEPHQYAGYSGGAKTVAIGCCGEPVITATHGMRFLEDPGVRLGRLAGNPFQETVRELGRRAGLRFCINVVTDDRERVVAIASGAPGAMHDHLAGIAAELYTRPIDKQYDVAIAGVGAPKDVNLYQASRAATYLRFAPTPVVREGGAIILAARLDEGAGEGAGEQRFLAALASAASPTAVVESARAHFAGGEQRAVMVALTLQHCEIIVAASTAPDVVRAAKLRATVDMEDALELAHEHIGRPRRASVLLVPRALHTLPVVRGSETAAAP